MARHITDELDLYLRVEKMIPKHLKAMGFDVDDIVESCECDEIDGGDGYDPCYWVYLKDGFITENGCGSHTIHEDTLADIKAQMSCVKYVEADLKR